jgi:hypothetical protein
VGTTGAFYTWVKSTNTTPGTYTLQIDGTTATETFGGLTTQNTDNAAYYNFNYGVLGGRYTTTPGWHTVTFTVASGTVTPIGIALPPVNRYRGSSAPKVVVGGTPWFSYAVTAYSITSNVITLTGGQPLSSAYGVGKSITLQGFPTSTFLNGQICTVTGESPTSITATLQNAHANTSATEYGQALGGLTQIPLFNAAQLAVSKTMVADGLNVPFADINANLDPVYDYSYGAVQGWPATAAEEHPSNRGHYHFAQAIEAVLGATGLGTYSFLNNAYANYFHITDAVYVGNAYADQTSSFTVYAGDGSGSYMSFAGVNGDPNIHLTATQGGTGGGVIFQGNMAWTSYVPFYFDGGLTYNNISTAGDTCAGPVSGGVVNCYNSTSAEFVVPAGTTSAVVSMGQIKAGSDITFGWDLSNSVVGCSGTAPTNMATLMLPYVSARTAGTSFTLTFPVAPVANPICLTYTVVN